MCMNAKLKTEYVCVCVCWGRAALIPTSQLPNQFILHLANELVGGVVVSMSLNTSTKPAMTHTEDIKMRVCRDQPQGKLQFKVH